MRCRVVTQCVEAFHDVFVVCESNNIFVFAICDCGINPLYYQVYASKEDLVKKKPVIEVPSPKDYFQDLDFVLSVISDGPTKSFAFRRLKYLESKWNMYILLNEYEELAEAKRVPHRDFYNIRKVDTHVHHTSCMNQKHLLRFIKSQMRRTPDDVVIYRDGKDLTLEEVFQSLNLTAYDLSIDTLDMHVSFSVGNVSWLGSVVFVAAFY